MRTANVGCCLADFPCDLGQAVSVRACTQATQEKSPKPGRLLELNQLPGLGAPAGSPQQHTSSAIFERVPRMLEQRSQCTPQETLLPGARAAYAGSHLKRSERVNAESGIRNARMESSGADGVASVDLSNMTRQHSTGRFPKWPAGLLAQFSFVPTCPPLFTPFLNGARPPLSMLQCRWSPRRSLRIALGTSRLKTDRFRKIETSL